MLMKNYQIMFFAPVALGTIVAVSSNSWFTCWVGLEINLMGLIPLILFNINKSNTEAAIKYFLLQAMASVMIIFFSSLELLSTSSSINSWSSYLILAALGIKAGLAPFHFWFPQVMMNLPWAQCLVILTWQKIAPFILMSYFPQTSILILFMTISAFVGALGGLNQISLKLILTYSSIAHSSWMLMLCSSSINFWSSYFIIYTLISLALIFPFYIFSITSFLDLSNPNMPSSIKSSLIFNIMSLGGLPPFLGFSAKFIAIKTGLLFIPIYVISILILSSLVSLFYYFKISHKILFLVSKKSFLEFNNNFYFKNSWMTASIGGNLIIPILVLLT